MDEKAKGQKKFQIEEIHEVIRAPLFQKYYATNVRGGLTDQDFRFEFFNEQLFSEGKWQYISDCMVVMSPRGAKTLSVILQDALALYEREHGVIRSQTAAEIQQKNYSAEPPKPVSSKKE